MLTIIKNLPSPHIAIVGLIILGALDLLLFHAGTLDAAGNAWGVYIDRRPELIMWALGASIVGSLWAACISAGRAQNCASHVLVTALLFAFYTGALAFLRWQGEAHSAFLGWLFVLSLVGLNLALAFMDE